MHTPKNLGWERPNVPRSRSFPCRPAKILTIADTSEGDRAGLARRRRAPNRHSRLADLADMPGNYATENTGAFPHSLKHSASTRLPLGSTYSVTFPGEGGVGLPE